VSSPTLVLAEALLNRGDVDEAGRLFERVLRVEGNDPRAHYGLARIALTRGDSSTSLRHLAASVQGAPWVQATHTLLAEVYFARGERERAEEEVAIANRLSPTASWPDPDRAEVTRLRIGVEPAIEQAADLIQQNRVGEAVEVLGRAAAEYPDSFDVALALGKAYLRLQPGDYPAAERAFRAAVRLRPDDPAAHFHLGISLEQQRQFPQAAASYAQAVTLKPDYAAARYNRGECLLQTGDVAGAREEFRSAARIKPNFAEAHRELGDLLARDNRLEEAVAELEQAARLAPKDPKTRQLLEEVRKKVSSKMREQVP
jgi:Flp pilus assembly protein TadD